MKDIVTDIILTDITVLLENQEPPTIEGFL